MAAVPRAPTDLALAAWHHAPKQRLDLAPIIDEHLQNTPFPSTFAYVCPEPVLVKWFVFIMKWHIAKKASPLPYPPVSAPLDAAGTAVAHRRQPTRQTRCAQRPATWSSESHRGCTSAQSSLYKTHLFSQLFLCLSRACLGKMIVFT